MITNNKSDISFGMLKINYNSMVKNNHSELKISQYKKYEEFFAGTVAEIDKLGYDLFIKGQPLEGVTYGIKQKGKSHYEYPARLAHKSVQPAEVFNNLFAESFKAVNEKITMTFSALGKKPR